MNKKYFMGAVDGQFFIGTKEENNPVLENALAIIFSQSEDNASTNIQLSNPVPLAFEKNDGSGMEMISIPMDRFTYVQCLSDINGAKEFIEYYDNAVLEESTIKPKVEALHAVGDVEKEDKGE